MLRAEDLLDHASRLLATATDPGVETDFRRVVSASYYAVFQLITSAVVEQMCPPTPHGLRGRSQRALEHGTMKKAMASFLTADSVKRLPETVRVPCTFSRDLAEIAQTFAELQDARQLADYDVVDAEGIVSLSWASDCLDRARRTFEAWDRAKATDEAALFLAALVFGAKWIK